jgi:hypothetical protein
MKFVLGMLTLTTALFFAGCKQDTDIDKLRTYIEGKYVTNNGTTIQTIKYSNGVLIVNNLFFSNDGVQESNIIEVNLNQLDFETMKSNTSVIDSDLKDIWINCKDGERCLTSVPDNKKYSSTTLMYHNSDNYLDVINLLEKLQ